MYSKRFQFPENVPYSLIKDPPLSNTRVLIMPHIVVMCTFSLMYCDLWMKGPQENNTRGSYMWKYGIQIDSAHFHIKKSAGAFRV